MTKLSCLVILAHIATWNFVALALEPDKAEKGKYRNIEIVRFTISEGVQFPTDYLVTLSEELVTELQETKKFQEVLRDGEKPANSEVPKLRLTGTVTQFNPGSRAKRYLIGFGAGKTKVVARVKFIDHQTDQVLLEDDVDGKVWIGFIGGESIGATRGLAKEVAKVAKEKF